MIGAGITHYKWETLKDRLVPDTVKKEEETILLPTTKWGETAWPFQNASSKEEISTHLLSSACLICKNTWVCNTGVIGVEGNALDSLRKDTHLAIEELQGQMEAS